MKSLFGVAILLSGCALVEANAAEAGRSLTDTQSNRPGFQLWSALELEQRSAQLGRTIRAEGSSRETLADYLTPERSHRFRFIRRDQHGLPEQHDNIEDYVYIHSGNGTILVGGEMAGESNVPGAEISGGSLYPIHPICAGDKVHIPAGMPHADMPSQDGHITYVLLRVPAIGE